MPRAQAGRQAASKAGERLARRIARNEPLTFDTMPSMEAIDAEVLRSPVGRTIGAICRDFGISPSLCDGAFWSRLFDAVRWYRGSIGNLVVDVKQREQRFQKDEWQRPGMELPEVTRDGIRRVLGFRIGENSGRSVRRHGGTGGTRCRCRDRAALNVACRVSESGATGPEHGWPRWSDSLRMPVGAGKDRAGVCADPIALTLGAAHHRPLPLPRERLSRA